MRDRFGGIWQGGGIILAILLASSPAAFASRPGSGLTLPGEASFAPEDLQWGSAQGYDTVYLPGFVSTGQFGYAELPARSQSFLLPDGYHVAELRIDQADRAELPGTKHLIPVATPGTAEPVLREAPGAYQSAGEYPGAPVELTGSGFWRGQRVAEVTYHPLGWTASTGRVAAYRHVIYTLILAPDGPDQPKPLRQLRSFPGTATATAARIAAHVENAPLAMPSDSLQEGIATYTPFRPTDYPSLDGSMVEYVIITPDGMASTWQTWADWKTQRGVPAVVKTLSWIDANYPGGSDQPARIRMFIRDAYQKWGTNYVLLGGDTGKIPVRYAHSRYYFDNGEDIPTDLYYECLDGTWDGNGNGIYGEGYVFGAPGDSVDLYPEVEVGRAPVKTSSDATTFITKNKSYRLTPIALNQTTAAFLGEVLFPYGWSWPDTLHIWLNGCDIAHQSMSELRPPFDSVYVCEYPDRNMSYTAVKNILSQGYGFVSVITHGDAFKFSTSDGAFFRIKDMDSLANNNKFSVFFYSNCSTSQFDADCINESAIMNPNGGGIAVIGPSRLEFPQISRDYMAEFYRQLCQTQGELLGDLNDSHKMPFVGNSFVDGASRWVYLASELLGDPELRLWKVLPDSMTVTSSSTMNIGDSLYTVSVTHSGSPVQGALVTLCNLTTKDYSRGLTDATGTLVLHYHPSATGTVNLAVSHSLYKSRSLSFAVISTGANLTIADVNYKDDGTGGSIGNGNGIPEAGERIQLAVKLKNVGSVSATGAASTLSLAAGSKAIFNVLENGVSQPLRVFIGQGAANPAALPDTIPFQGASPSPWGKPYFTPSGVADSGAYVWNDLAGWHFRFVGGLSKQNFRGTVTTDGLISAVHPYQLESTDSLASTSNSVNFFFASDTTEYQDGFDVVMSDSSLVTVVNGSASYGTLAPGDTLTRFFLAQTGVAAPDQQQARFVLTTTANAPGPLTWAEGVRTEVEAPILDEEFHAIDDSTDGGNKNGIIDTGETVRLLSSVRNLGHGAANAVTGVLRAVSGVTVLDSVASYGDIYSGYLNTAATPYRITATGTPKVVNLVLTDSYGRTTTTTIGLAVPDQPTAMVAKPIIPQIDQALDLTWTKPVATDLLGYNIYRANGGSTAFSRINTGMVTRSAFYHDTSVICESTYVYKVAGVDSAGNEGPATAPLTAAAPPHYQGSFPRSTQGAIWSSPVVADLGFDTSGKQEVLVGSEDGYLYCLNYDGTTRVGWPKYLGGEIWSSPAVGNLNDDSPLEIVVGCNNSKLYAFRYNGSGLTSPDGTFATLDAQVRSSPALVDLDGDGKLEVVVGSYGGKIYAFRRDGTPYLPGNPVFATIGGNIAATPTVADIDGDGHPEVLVGNLQGKIYCFRYDGTPYNSPTGLWYDTGSSIWSSLAVGDLDGDGQQDIVGAAMNGYIYRWDKNGNVQPGWPKVTGAAIWGSPALGDLNGDGKLEVVVGSMDKNVYVLQANDTNLPGWPQAVGDSIWGSCSLSDVTGDGHPDVFVTCADKHFYGFKSDGTTLPGWPLLFTDQAYNSAPAITDLDRDGFPEVVAASYDGRIYAWKIHHPWNPNPSSNPWPMYHHDPYRTGWYTHPQSDVPLNGPAGAVVASGLEQNAPNPFNPKTVIRYALAKEGPMTLSIYDVGGRRVKSLVSGVKPAGRYEVQWDGSDDHGRGTASGVYFYRLETGKESFTRKMVLVR